MLINLEIHEMFLYRIIGNLNTQKMSWRIRFVAIIFERFDLLPRRIDIAVIGTFAFDHSFPCAIGFYL